MIHMTSEQFARIPRRGPETAQDARRARRTANHPTHRSEAEIKREVLKALKLSGFFAIRINSGATFGETNGRKWAIRNAAPGTADVLVLVRNGSCYYPVWLECKTDTGKQSQAQKEFEKSVVEQGHAYAIVHAAQEAVTICRGRMLTEAF